MNFISTLLNYLKLNEYDCLYFYCIKNIRTTIQSAPVAKKNSTAAAYILTHEHIFPRLCDTLTHNFFTHTKYPFRLRLTITVSFGLGVKCSLMAREIGVQSQVESYQRLKGCT